MADQKRRAYLIQDPFDDDAQLFISTIFLATGLRPVCFYTNRKARFFGELAYPSLRGNLIEASIDCDLADLATFVEKVRRDYDIVGIIPYREDTVDVAARLVELLDIPWNEPATLYRFRDKHALKEHLRPSVRVPGTWLVRGLADLESIDLPDRYVLKPNDGFGNRHVGIFERDSDASSVHSHLQRSPGTTWILEEFVGGTEYHVNGQVRLDGSVDITAVFEYRRRQVNGYETVYEAEVQCASTHPHFDCLADYGRRLIEASGLRGCPFHLEAKVDDAGPAMIDVGARLPSDGGGAQLSRCHPGRPDVYSVAAHDYLGVAGFASDPVDWEAHDRSMSVLVYGISTSAGRITGLRGVEDVEAMPEFIHWVIRPNNGDRLVRTTDLRGTPYIAAFSFTGAEGEADRIIELVHRTVQWRHRAPSLGGAYGGIRTLARRGRRKLRWVVRDVRRRVWDR